MGYGFLLLDKPLLGLFVGSDEAAIYYGSIRMKNLMSLYFLAGISGIIASTLQAFGYSIVPMLNSIFSVLILRVIWMSFIFPYFQTPENLYFCYFVSWSLSFLIGAIVLTFIFPKKLRQMRQDVRIFEALTERSLFVPHKEE